MDHYRANTYERSEPCLNCAGFHYGRCFHPPRQCWCCGDFGHIQRYCPRNPRNRSHNGEPLPGSRVWCEMYGLNEDQDLKWKVLDTLKTLPGASVFIDDTCIMQGMQVHLIRGRLRQVRTERPLAERITRRRSRSPSRERNSHGRDRTPLATYRCRSRSYDSIVSMNEMDEFRSRARMAYSSGTNAVVFEAAYNYQDRHASLEQRSNQQENLGVSNIRELEKHANQRAAVTSDRPATRRVLQEMGNIRVPQASQQRQSGWIRDPLWGRS